MDAFLQQALRGPSRSPRPLARLALGAALCATLGGCKAGDDVTSTALQSLAEDEALACLTECTERIGIVSAFGAEADILLAETEGSERYLINGNTFTTGTLRDNPVVIVLSGVSVVNATMITQLMIDHFGVTHLLMSGIAGGLNPDNHIGDVIVPERWSMPLEAYFSNGSDVPAPCGAAGDLSCLGLQIAEATSTSNSDYSMTGLFMRDTHVVSERTGPEGEFKFAFEVDPTMLATVRSIAPDLQRCGEAEPTLCVATQPELKIGGAGMSGSMFIANPAYRDYVFAAIGAEVVDMETAALGQVAHANGLPFLAFRSLSDLAGGDESAEVGAFFGSGLAESNEARVTLGFLEAWIARP